MSMLKLLRQNHGSVMLEAVLTIPILISLTFAIIQVGTLFFMLNSLNHITFEMARSMSVGAADDEANGQLIDCSLLEGVSSNGKKSAEKIMCDEIEVLPGTFEVSASDGVSEGIGAQGAVITTRLNVLSSSMIIYNPTDAFDTINLLQATATQIKETTHVDANHD
jgi:Flp pilus assembly protein TadG